MTEDKSWVELLISATEGRPCRPGCNDLQNNTERDRKETKGGSAAPEIRTFDTGATRSNEPDRIDWIKLFSFPVLFRYAEYMNKHSVQPDGSIRPMDNWKKGIPKGELLESLFRHVLDLVALHEGVKGMRENTVEDSCCAIMFNIMGYLDWHLRESRGRAEGEETIERR